MEQNEADGGGRKWAWPAAIVVILLVNAVGYRIYRSTRPAPPEVATVQVAPPVAVDAGVQVEVKAAPPQKDGAVARARRVAGLNALEQGEYGVAVKELSAALRLGGGGEDVAELLKIARELEDRAARQKRQEASAVAEAPRPRPKKSSPRRRPEPVAQAEPEEQEPPEEEKEKPGLLLVTSQPQGLVVEINGRSADLTPARRELSAGVHRVALIRGTKEVHVRLVEVIAGEVTTVDVDLTEALAPPPPPVAAAEPKDPQPAPAVAAAAPVAAAPAPPKESGSGGLVAAPAGQGELYVTSPAIYGEVFINGRGYGYPPLLAKGVPAGNAVVELKVGGVTRRTLKVEVVPNQRLAARIR